MSPSEGIITAKLFAHVVQCDVVIGRGEDGGARQRWTDRESQGVLLGKKWDRESQGVLLGKKWAFCVVRGGAGLQGALKKLQAVLLKVLLFQFQPRLNFCLFSPQQEQVFISSSIKNRKVGKMFKASLWLTKVTIVVTFFFFSEN